MVCVFNLSITGRSLLKLRMNDRNSFLSITELNSATIGLGVVDVPGRRYIGHGPTALPTAATADRWSSEFSFPLSAMFLNSTVEARD